MSSFPILNSKAVAKSINVKNEDIKDECDKYKELNMYKSVESKYKLLYNMNAKELEMFKQCQIKWLKEQELN
jgi:hypothetical protein